MPKQVDISDCPSCGKEATLYAEATQNGKIGIFCHNCAKGYYTTDPNDGWDIMEYSFKSPKSLEKREQELAKIHNIDMDKEMLMLAEIEFKSFISGNWELS